MKREWEVATVEGLSQFVTSSFEVRQEFESSRYSNKKSDRPCRSIASHLFPAFGVAGPERRGQITFLWTVRIVAELQSVGCIGEHVRQCATHGGHSDDSGDGYESDE